MSLNDIFLEQNCEHALKTCNFAGVTGENCAAQFCNGFRATSGTCPEINLDPKNCCESSDPASCLQQWIHGGGGGSGSGDASGNPCASVVSIIVSCSSASPALFPSSSIYTAGPEATSLAGCLCYDGDGTYDASRLDGFASTCVASGSAAHPTYFPYASRLDGFCGNIGGGQGAAPASVTVTATAEGGSDSSLDATATSNAGTATGTATGTSNGQAAESSSSSSGTTVHYCSTTLLSTMALVLSLVFL